MILDDENSKLQAVLAGAATGSELSVVVSYEEHFIGKVAGETGTDTKTSNNDFIQASETNGTTLVDILDSPEVDYKRQVKNLTVYNESDTAATVSIIFYDGTDSFIIVKSSIQIGETLQYNRHDGWRVIDAQGRIKTSLSAFAENIEDAINDGVTDKAPSENAVYDALQTKLDKKPNLTSIDDTGIADDEIAIFDLTNKKLKTSDKKFTTDGELDANSDANIPTEKAVKTYVDTGGFKRSVRMATTAPLSNGYSGTATTIQSTSLEAFPDTPDGVTPVLGDSILIKDETGGNEIYNGIWIFTSMGSGLSAWTLSRRGDANTDDKILQATVAIQEGATQKEQIWMCETDAPITLGVTSLTFVQSGSSENQKKTGIHITIDGQGGVISTGLKGFVTAPYAGTITGWEILADQSGSVVVDIWKDTYANFPPTVADTIAGTEKPTLSAAQKNQDLSLSSWTTSVAEGDILAWNVDSATTVTRVYIIIFITKN